MLLIVSWLPTKLRTTSFTLFKVSTLALDFMRPGFWFSIFPSFINSSLVAL